MRGFNIVRKCFCFGEIADFIPIILTKEPDLVINLLCLNIIDANNKKTVLDKPSRIRDSKTLYCTRQASPGSNFSSNRKW
ncbi:hypothetical protein D3C73_1322830 [compost metagenome]